MVSGSVFTNNEGGTLTADGSTGAVKLTVLGKAAAGVNPGTWSWENSAWVDVHTMEVYASNGNLLLATDSLADAVTAANNGGDGCTLRLVGDVTYSGDPLPSIAEDLTLDLNEHSITTSRSLCIGVENGGTDPAVTLQNGAIGSNTNVDAIQISSGNVTATNVDITTPVLSVSTASGVAFLSGL